MRLILLFLFTMSIFSYGENKLHIRKNIPFAIYYGTEKTPDDFKSYDLIVFDKDYHINFKTLSNAGKTVLGYLSLCEITKTDSYYDEIKNKNLFLSKNEVWKSDKIDIRKKEWVKYIIDEAIPKILHNNFDGIMIDTIDTAIALENSDPVKYKGMKQQAINLIKAIRYNFPQIKIMINRGYELHSKIIDDVDMILGESVYTTYDFKSKKYIKRTEEDYKYQVEKLKAAKTANPKIEIFTLDYWNEEDRNEIKKIYQIEDENEFNPFVSTIDLKNLINIK